MTPEEFFEKLKKEKPENQSLFKYLVKHPKREHSRDVLSKISWNLKQCKAENRLPSDILLNALKPYFSFLRR